MTRFTVLQTQSTLPPPPMSSPAPQAPVGSTLSVADELTKLQDLMDRGTITPQQFEVQKQKLLQGM